MIPQTFTVTVTSEHIRFYFLFFSGLHYLVVVSVREIKLTHIGFRAHVGLAADLRPSADGSSVRTSLVAGQLQANSLGSCATQPACYSPCWDRQTDRRTDRDIVNAPYGGGEHNKLN